MPTVSAIIPTYNRARCIGRAVESILGQTFEDLEVIVVDDGSTDDTAVIVNSYGGRVRYFRQENAGQGVARNLGVAHARAPWIAFLDSDDVWVAEKLATQLEATRALGCDVSFTDFSLKRDLTGEGFESWKGELQRRGLKGDLQHGTCRDPMKFIVAPGDLAFTSTLLIRKDVYEKSGGMKAKFRRCQDFELYLRLVLDCGARFGFVDGVLSRRELARNASRELTYDFRIKALADALDNAQAREDRASAAQLRKAILRESRALAGTLRRNGRRFDSIQALVRGIGLSCGRRWFDSVDQSPSFP